MSDVPADVTTVLEVARHSGGTLTLQGLIPEFIVERLHHVAMQERRFEAAEERLRGTEQLRDASPADLALMAGSVERELEHLRELDAVVWDAVQLWEGPVSALRDAVEAQSADALAPLSAVLARHQALAEETSVRRLRALRDAHDALVAAEEAARDARARRDARVRLAVESGATPYRVAQMLGVPTSTITRVLSRTTVARWAPRGRCAEGRAAGRPWCAATSADPGASGSTLTCPGSGRCVTGSRSPRWSSPR